MTDAFSITMYFYREFVYICKQMNEIEYDTLVVLVYTVDMFTMFIIYEVKIQTFSKIP